MNLKISIAILIIMILTIGGIVSSASRTSKPILTNSETDVDDYNYENITFNIVTDKSKYVKKEPVHISLQLTNTGNENVTIVRPSTQQGDFIVTGYLWHQFYRWSKGLGFGCAVSYITVEPGETWYWNQTWNQKGSIFSFMPFYFNHQLRPGVYKIIGVIPTLINTPTLISYTEISIIK